MNMNASPFATSLGLSVFLWILMIIGFAPAPVLVSPLIQFRRGVNWQVLLLRCSTT